MKKIFFIFFIFFSVYQNVYSLEIKIGTVAPAGSVWETTLKEIAAEWTRISNGEIVVRIYAGGTVGDEEDIVRKVKLGRLQAAALTSQGLKAISNDVFALSLPMYINDDDEFDFVFNKMKPVFNEIIEDKGFVPLGWAMTGWVKWFTKTKVVYPDDLRQIKIAVDNADEKALQIWQQAGFRIIPLSLPDLVSGIFSGMADGTYITPYAANTMGISELAPFMLDLNITPVYGALVINDRTWRRVDDRYKPLIIARTGEILSTFYQKIIEIEKSGLEIMKKQGLVVVETPQDAEQEWGRIIRDAVDAYAREIISSAVFTDVKKYINEYRQR